MASVQAVTTKLNKRLISSGFTEFCKWGKIVATPGGGRTQMSQGEHGRGSRQDIMMRIPEMMHRMPNIMDIPSPRRASLRDVRVRPDTSNSSRNTSCGIDAGSLGCD